MLYPNVMKRMIKNQILDHAEELELELTDEELNSAIAGVEYCVSECMADSIQDALSIVHFDRTGDESEIEPFTVEFTMSGVMVDSDHFIYYTSEDYNDLIRILKEHGIDNIVKEVSQFTIIDPTLIYALEDRFSL